MTDHTTSERVRELETELAALRAKLEAEQQPRFEPGDVLRWKGDDGLRFLCGRDGECYSSGTGYGDPNVCPDQYTKIATLSELVEFWEKHEHLRTKRKPLSECVDAEDIVRHYKGVKLRCAHWRPGDWLQCEGARSGRQVWGHAEAGDYTFAPAELLIKNGEIYHG